MLVFIYFLEIIYKILKIFKSHIFKYLIFGYIGASINLAYIPKSYSLESYKKSSNLVVNDKNKNENINPEYILGPSDEIYIRFGGLEIFSSNYFINPDGKVYLPEIGNIHVTGLTIKEFENKLIDAYKDIIFNPTFDLVITNYRPVTIYIKGQIKRPGLYTLDTKNRTTKTNITNATSQNEGSNQVDISIPLTHPKIFEAIKYANGVTSFADLSNIEVIRQNSMSQGGGQIKAKVNLLELIINGDQSQNIRLMDSDTVIVPKTNKIIKEQIAMINNSNLNPEEIKIIVGGNVETNGSLTLPKNTSLMEAVVVAGGNQFSSGSIDLVRFQNDGTTLKKKYRFNLNAKKDSKNNPILISGDVINIRKSLLGATSQIINEVGKPIIQSYGLYSIFN